jgi:hypothetical protein
MIGGRSRVFRQFSFLDSPAFHLPDLPARARMIVEDWQMETRGIDSSTDAIPAAQRQ